MELILYSSRNFRVSPEHVKISKIGSSDGVDELSKSPTDSCQDCLTHMMTLSVYVSTVYGVHLCETSD